MGEKESEDFISKQIETGVYKLCPFCGIPTDKIDGCNYVTCFCKKGKNNKSEWCFKCSKPKYIDGGCNDKTHNSH